MEIITEKTMDVLQWATRDAIYYLRTRTTAALRLIAQCNDVRKLVAQGNPDLTDEEVTAVIEQARLALQGGLDAVRK